MFKFANIITGTLDHNEIMLRPVAVLHRSYNLLIIREDAGHSSVETIIDQ